MLPIVCNIDLPAFRPLTFTGTAGFIGTSTLISQIGKFLPVYHFYGKIQVGTLGIFVVHNSIISYINHRSPQIIYSIMVVFQYFLDPLQSNPLLPPTIILLSNRLAPMFSTNACSILVGEMTEFT